VLWLRLTTLRAAGCGLSAPPGRALEVAPMLESVDLSRNGLTSLAGLGAAPRLRVVELGYNRLGPAVPGMAPELGQATKTRTPENNPKTTQPW